MKLPARPTTAAILARPAAADARVRLHRQPNTPRTRLVTTGSRDPSPTPGDKADHGTTKVYNKDGTNPNKNWVYVALGALGLGGFYAMFMAKPKKMAERELGSERKP
ncbi:hypothetical protein VTK26DRAFT_6026 [Humicola hyalothermophila]